MIETRRVVHTGCRGGAASRPRWHVRWGAVDERTKQRIEALLEEIRGWSGELRASAAQLAEKFGLEPLMVVRLAQAEGIAMPTPPEYEAPRANPRNRTLALDETPPELAAALQNAQVPRGAPADSIKKAGQGS